MLSAAASSLAAEAVVHVVDDGEAIFDDFHYLCGRIFSKNPVALPSLSAAVSTVWGLKEKVLIRQEEGGVLVFQFKDREVKDRVLFGDPWFFNNSMIVLADYDGISALKDVPLQVMEMWVAISGLPIKMRTEKVVSMIGQRMGEVVRVDAMAVQWKDPIQRVRVLVDVRRRLLPKGRFDFSPEISVVVGLEYEKSHGLCGACGFFDHDGGVCDKLVETELEALLRRSETAGTGLEVAPVSVVVSEPVRAPSDSFGSEMPAAVVEDGGCSAVVAASGVFVGLAALRGSPEFSTGNPSFKLGLTGGKCLTGLAAGPSFSGLGVQGPNGSDGLDLLRQGVLAAVRGEESATAECSVKRKRAIKLTEKALGLIQPPAKKRGKPIGAKGTTKKKTTSEMEPSLVYSGAPVSPDSKGKDKI